MIFLTIIINLSSTLAKEPPLVATDFSRKTELINEIREFDATWRENICSTDSRLDEELCNQVINSLVELESKIDTEIQTTADMIFYHKRLLFVADSKPMPNHLIGLLVVSEMSKSNIRCDAVAKASLNKFNSMLVNMEEDAQIGSEMGNCYLKKNQLPTTLPITSILSSWHYQLK